MFHFLTIAALRCAASETEWVQSLQTHDWLWQSLNNISRLYFRIRWLIFFILCVVHRIVHFENITRILGEIMNYYKNENQSVQYRISMELY